MKKKFILVIITAIIIFISIIYQYIYNRYFFVNLSAKLIYIYKDEQIKKYYLENEKYFMDDVFKYNNMKVEEQQDFYKNPNNYEVYHIRCSLENKTKYNVYNITHTINDKGIWLAKYFSLDGATTLNFNQKKEKGMSFIIKKDNMTDEEIENKIKSITVNITYMLEVPAFIIKDSFGGSTKNVNIKASF